VLNSSVRILVAFFLIYTKVYVFLLFYFWLNGKVKQQEEKFFLRVLLVSGTIVEADFEGADTFICEVRQTHLPNSLRQVF